MIEQAERVERVADDLCDGPGCDKQQHAVLTLHLQKHTQKDDGRRTDEHAVVVTLWQAHLFFFLSQKHAWLFVSDAQRSEIRTHCRPLVTIPRY